MRVVVVDASYLLTFLLPDEESEPVSELVNQYGEGTVYFIAPHILPFEVANGLKSAILRGRLNPEKAIELIETFLAMHVASVPVDYSSILRLAMTSKLSIYDAAYAWLARSRGYELMTHDKKLAKIARA